MDRASQMCLVAANQSLSSANLRSAQYRPLIQAAAVIIGTGVGSAMALEKAHFDYFASHRTSAHAIPASMPHAAAAVISIQHAIQGPSYTITTACSSGAAAIGLGFLLIRQGLVSTVLAGGCDSCLTGTHLDNWRRLGVLSSREAEPAQAVRPFSRDRDGFALGEGAAMVVLEDLEAARRRGVEPYAEVLGYGASSDATHITSPSPDGQARAMFGAIKMADLSPDQIGYVNAHGTATRLNDRTETTSMKAVFADRLPPVSSIKAVTGHMLGASGACEFIATVLALRCGMLPPTANFYETDPECDLDCIAEGARSADVRFAMSNSFGFGGNNASLVAGRYAA
jgi:3-oxoacyl-(acyl-carrier-protein) synthase